MVHRRGKTDDISCRLSSAKCGEERHACDRRQRRSSRRQNQNRIRIDVGAGGRCERERAVLCAVKEEQKKLDKVIIRGKGREGMDLLLLRPYDTRPTNTNHHLGSSSSKEGTEGNHRLWCREIGCRAAMAWWRRPWFLSEAQIGGV